MNVASRLDGVRRRIKDDGAAAAMISMGSNLKYLTAFDGVIDEGINGACVITETSARFYTDSRYVEAATSAAEGGPWEVCLAAENLYVTLSEQLRSENVSTLLVESGIPYGRFKFVAEQFLGAVRAVDDIVEKLRVVKESEEIERIAAAAAIADRGFDHMLEYIKPGVSEEEIAIELEYFMRRAGSEEMPFAPIIASGPNGARPHSIPGGRVLESGDLLVMDFGAKVGGYCSDMTRTVAIGKVSDDHKRLYEAVLKANRAGVDAVRAGVPCAEVDRIARDVLAAEGLLEHFTHGLGHGVGLDIHESPRLAMRSTQSLRAGAVVTIEPGVYLEGIAGVRIEDLVVVEEQGCRVLTASPKELIQI